MNPMTRNQNQCHLQLGRRSTEVHLERFLETMLEIGGTNPKRTAEEAFTQPVQSHGCASTERLPKELWFYSCSKPDGIRMDGDREWRKYLSNFQEIPNGFHWKGNAFPSVEYAFHWEKFQRTNMPELASAYLEKGRFERPGMAKVFSGRASMETLGTILDVDKWNKERVWVSAQLVQARYLQDPHFARILREAKAKDYFLVHFERGTSKKPPFWGAMIFKSGERAGERIGENMLGKQLMELVRDARVDKIPRKGRWKNTAKRHKGPQRGKHYGTNDFYKYSDSE